MKKNISFHVNKYFSSWKEIIKDNGFGRKQTL